jgi:plastocyanin
VKFSPCPPAFALFASAGRRSLGVGGCPALVTVCVVFLATLVSAQTSPQGVGIIRGRVDVRRALTPPVERRPSISDLGTAVPHDPIDFRRSVVYLESAPAAAFADVEPQRARMDQRNATFVPHVLAITVGTTVDFPNNDHTYHNVFSLRGPKPFDLGRYAAGKSRSVRFDRPGIVRVFCEIHSHMSAFILVFSHRYFAVTASDGRYQIGRVPPGRYTLVAWNEGAVRESRPIVVPEDQSIVEADFSLR